jgi:protein TonB
LEVQIGADNAVAKAVVVSDPGYGFGQEARRCALRRRWLSQLDRSGAAVTGRATVVVNFVR